MTYDQITLVPKCHSLTTEKIATKAAKVSRKIIYIDVKCYQHV